MDVGERWRIIAAARRIAADAHKWRGNARRAGSLTLQQSEWQDVGVYFRNKSVHGFEFALTPGRADWKIAALHRWVVDMLECRKAPDAAAAEPAED